jgi:MFS family permease
MLGRLLSQMGTGFVLFAAPVFFVNQVGLSPAAVGLGLGCESITGVFGRIFGGSMSDSPRWGRRKTLMMAVLVSAIADLVFAVSNNFFTFLLGNLLMGVGVGLYWPSSETIVADLAPQEHRHEAFALNRLADSVGLSLGVVLSGAWIAATGSFRALFIVDAVSFLLFWAVAYRAITESRPKAMANPSLASSRAPAPWQGWSEAWRDRPLRIFVAANILFTTYIAFISSTLPIYFTNFVSQSASANFTPKQISALFAAYVALAALTQLPIARFLKRFANPQALMISAGCWAVGFCLIWVTGTVATGQLAWAAAGIAVLAIATVSYTPAASSLVVGLAPEALRGVYLSVNSLCWAGGYFFGPVLGGWAMNHDRAIANGFWLAIAASLLGVLAILQILTKALTEPVQL